MVVEKGMKRACALFLFFSFFPIFSPTHAGPRAPERFHLGRHAFKITTRTPAAQQAFNRGLTLAYAFSHGAAEREFREAARLDPTCAMAWWGIALVNGPHINFPVVPPDRAAVAWEALTAAREHVAGTTPIERGLIEALGTRYQFPQPENRRPLDEAYAAAMRSLWKTFPGSSDVGTLFAESMMDLRPWDLWTLDGKPQPGTDEIVATLERVMTLDPNHPGALHLYIHAVEASTHPEKAVPAADRLLPLVPGAGHLVHMPSHIYARVGRWSDASMSNKLAMRADTVFRAKYPRPGFFALYMAHNTHFFAFSAMMRGRKAEALQAARDMVAKFPEEFIKDFTPAADMFVIFPAEVMMRFGMWEEILNEPEPRAELPLSRALWRFTRAVALTALGRLDEAEREQAAFKEAAGKVPAGWPCGNNSASTILEIAEKTLAGEMAAKRDNFDKAVALLREAVKVEDTLRYDEPPDWLQPVRHTLGAVLLRANRFAEAEAVYREDLAKFPENGWSLFGLKRSLELQRKNAEAAKVERRFKQIWAGSDVKIGATCFCQPGV